MPGEITLWSLVRFLHVAGAIVWVGGQLTLSAVVTPVARRHLAPAELAGVLSVLGRRRQARVAAMAGLGASLLVVLLATSLVP